MTRFYLPTTTAAGIRADRFVRALVESGFRVIVVTVGGPAAVEEVSDRLIVCRVSDRGVLPESLKGNARAWPWWQVLPGPSPDAFFSNALFRAAQMVLATYGADVLFATGLPYGLLAVAHELGVQSGLPLVVEFRDCWYTGKPWPYTNFCRRWMAKIYESRCVRDAAAVITETEAQKKVLADAYGPDIAAKTTTIRHCFEPEPAQNVAKPSPPVFSKRSDELVIAYVGQLRGLDVVDVPLWRSATRGIAHMAGRVLLGANYCEQLRLDWMSPHYLMEALAHALSQTPSMRQRVRLVFAGQRFDKIDTWAARWGLAGQVVQLGSLPPDQAQQVVEQADILVLSLYGIVGCDYHWCVPGKTYAYLGTGKPILGLLPPGEAADLITRAGTGTVVPPDDVPAIACRLEDFFHQYQVGRIKVHPDREFVNQFALSVQRHKLVTVMRAVLDTSLKKGSHL